MFDEQIGQYVDHVVRPEPAQRHHRQAFPAELVDDVEHPIFATVMRPILDEVIRPHMSAMLRAQPDARSVAEPEPPTSRLSLGNLETLPPPDPLTTDKLTCQPAWPSNAWIRR